MILLHNKWLNLHTDIELFVWINFVERLTNLLTVTIINVILYYIYKNHLYMRRLMLNDT